MKRPGAENRAGPSSFQAVFRWDIYSGLRRLPVQPAPETGAGCLPPEPVLEDAAFLRAPHGLQNPDALTGQVLLERDAAQLMMPDALGRRD